MCKLFLWWESRDYVIGIYVKKVNDDGIGNCCGVSEYEVFYCFCFNIFEFGFCFYKIGEKLGKF